MTISTRRFATNAIWLLAGAMMTRAISAVALILIARQLGVERYGQFVASQSITGLTIVLVTLGMEGLVLYEGGRDRARLPQLMAAGVVLVLVLGIPWMVGITLISTHLDTTVFVPSFVALAALAFWLDGLSMIAWSTFKAALKNRALLVLMASTQFLWLVLVGLCAVLQVRDPLIYLAGSAASSLLAAVVSLWYARRAFGWQLDLSAVRPIARASLPFALSIAFALIYGKADVSIVAFYLGRIAVGWYGPAITMVSALVLVPVTMYGVLVPTLSRLHAEQPGRILKLMPKIMLGMTGLGLCLSVMLAIVARPVVQWLYGAEFAPAGEVLVVLAGVLGLRCVNIGLAAILVAIGCQRHRAAMQGMSAGLNIALNLIFVRQWGILGAAAIYVISELALAIGYGGLVMIWRGHGQQPVGIAMLSAGREVPK
jgi:O-antigen/teichoic acid export membrane protein